MKINLVLNDSSWVMEDLANHFHKYLSNSSISYGEDLSSDVNFYFNWHAMKRKTSFDVCWFTHIENRQWWDNVVGACDVAVMHGRKFEHTVPKEKRIIFNPPPFEHFLKEDNVKILVVGREYASGRKKFSLANKLSKINFLDVSFTNGKLSREQLIEAYDNTDYVLVTSENEAGPMCVVEAIARNKPVIAPDVGWCWDYPVIKFSGEKELTRIVYNLRFPINCWETQVKILEKEIGKRYEESRK